ncbi:MAG: restriction endonuclease subunit S [Sulfitobacter sp.]
MSVPTLRFAEFKGEWDAQLVGSILERESKPVEVVLNQSYRQIGVRSHGRGLFHKDAVTGLELAGKRVFHVVPNSLVINIVFAWEQALTLTTDEEVDFIASHRFPMFLEKDGKSFLPFIRELFLRKRGKQLLELASPGGAGRNKTLGQQNFLELKVRVPKRSEQKKIAAFLGVVDDKLSALRARKAGLERYKRGLMQKLFSRTLRFTKPDGSAFPDWEDKRLGDVFTWHKTNSLSRENLNYEAGEVQNIHYGDIHTKFKASFRQTEETVPFVSDGAAPKGFAKDEFCQIGDVVIADASEDYADIGKAIEVVELSDTPLVAGLHTYIARPRGQLVTGFSGYMLRSANMRKQIMTIAQGVSVLGISKTNLEKLRLHLPHPEEQTLIANALQAMDAKIQAVSDQITRMEGFKKGLLQQMFV